MPACARKEIIDDSTVGMYHCTARCVRRAFLCGQDALTGRSFEHRKEWVRKRLETLAGVFAIDICGYAVLGNHLHLVLRNRPDVLKTWDDARVARRWWKVFPGRRRDDGEPDQLGPSDLALMLADPDRRARRRERLGSISWFMRCLCERIARDANTEDDCSGRFWEGRFRCVALLDEAAVLACSMYVDLNPIRAGLATTPEKSLFTSACDRITAWKARQKKKARRRGLPAARDGWLCPIRAQRPSSSAATKAKTVARPTVKGKKKKRVRRRASSESFLPMSLRQYVTLLDWTGRQLRGDKRGAIPQKLRPILQRLGIVEDGWLACVSRFGKMFHRAAGTAKHLAERAERAGRSWFQGVTSAREAFG